MRKLFALTLAVALQLTLVGCDCSAGPTTGRDSGPARDANTDRDSGGSDDICDDGLDNDGDGRVDEGCDCAAGSSQMCFRGEPGLAGIGGCVWGSQNCTSDFEFSEWDVCLGDGSASDEVCDGVDNNCDGTVDEGCDCLTGMVRACYFGPAGTEGFGGCRGGVETCLETSEGSGWSSCEGWTGPGTEVCGGGDENCDGRVDEGCACTLGAMQPCYAGPSGTEGRGVCRGGTQTCIAGGGGVPEWGPCNGEMLPGTEVCTGGLDEDCDDTVDCADTDCGATCCIPYGESLAVIPVEGEIFFVIDRSGSMDWPAVGTTRTRWQELMSAMDAVLPMLAPLTMGMLTFPELDGTSELLNCAVGSPPDVGISLGTGPAISSRLIAADPRAGDTPTPLAFMRTDSYLGATSTTRERFVILATDGLPEPNCGATVAATVSAISSLRSTQGIDTFVLGIVGPDPSGDTSGIPALQDALNQFADAGGRARSGSTRYYEAGDGPALTSSLTAIVAAATDCQFELAAPPPRPTRIEVRQDSTIVPPSAYTLTGTTLTFSGTYCAQIQAGLVSSVTVSDDCS